MSYPYSKPNSSMSAGREFRSRHPNSSTKNNPPESSFNDRSTSQEPKGRELDFPYRDRLKISQRVITSPKIDFASSIRSAGATPLYTRGAANESTYYSFPNESQNLNRSMGYFPPSNLQTTATSFQNNPPKNDSHVRDFGTETIAKSSYNKAFPQNQSSQELQSLATTIPARKYDEEKLQRIIDAARQRQFESYGYPKERNESNEKEERPLQLRQYEAHPLVNKNLPQENYSKSLPVSSERNIYSDTNQNKYGTTFFSATTPAPDQNSLENLSFKLETMNSVLKNSILNHLDKKYHKGYSPEDEKGFSFRDNKDSEFGKRSSAQDELNVLKSSPHTYEDPNLHEKILKNIINEAKNSQFLNNHEKKPSNENLKVHIKSYVPKEIGGVYSHSPPRYTDSIPYKTENLSVESRNQTNRQEHLVPSYQNSVIRNIDGDHHSLHSPLPSSFSGLRSSSISKKTFYTIENSNIPAIRAFSNTISTLAHSGTPEKTNQSLAEVQLPFQELQNALTKQNVHINRVIIETVENYTDLGSANVYKKPEEYSRPDTLPIPSKVFEPPIFQNRPELFEVKEIQPKAETQEQIVKRLEYPLQMKSQDESQASQNLFSQTPSLRSHEEHLERDFQDQLSSLQNVLPHSEPLKNISRQELSFPDHEKEKPIDTILFKRENEQENRWNERSPSNQGGKEVQPPSVTEILNENNNQDEKSEKYIEELRKKSGSNSISEKKTSPEFSSQKASEGVSHSNLEQINNAQNDVASSQTEEKFDNKSAEVSLEKIESNKSAKYEEPTQQLHPEADNKEFFNNIEENPNNNFSFEEEKKENKLFVERPKQDWEDFEKSAISHRADNQNIEKPTKTSTTKTKPKSSNFAVKAVVVLLVLLLLGLLGLELVGQAE